MARPGATETAETAAGAVALIAALVHIEGRINASAAGGRAGMIVRAGVVRSAA
jgi:hypothetical protein